MLQIVYQIQSNLVRALFAFVCLILSTQTFAFKYIYPQLSPHVTANISVTPFTHCVDHVALIAHNLNDYVYLMVLYDDFVFDQMMRFLPVCLLPPMIVAEDRYDPLSIVATFSSQIKTAQVVKVQAQGNAFVSDAVMQLAHSDTYQVFIHELAHFAGFLDEYPMSAAAARFQCNIARQAPNVIHASQLDENTSQPHPYADIFVAQLNLRPSKRRNEYIGCGDHEKHIQRYLMHPNDFNFLRFFDVPYIPYLYQYLWQQQVLQGRTSQIITGTSS